MTNTSASAGQVKVTLLFVVERAMYANDSAGVTWAAGTNAVGTKLR